MIFKEDEESELVYFDWMDEEGGEGADVTSMMSEVDNNMQSQKSGTRHHDDKTIQKGSGMCSIMIAVTIYLYHQGIVSQSISSQSVKFNNISAQKTI